MCLVDAYLSEEVDKQMAEDYGPLNVVLTRYPVGSIVNLTINDITRTVITNTLSKTPANVTVLALSQRVAKMFLVDKDGFVRCQYNVNHVQLPIQKESHGLISIELMICIFFGGLIILAMILPFMLPLL